MRFNIGILLRPLHLVAFITLYPIASLSSAPPGLDASDLIFHRRGTIQGANYGLNSLISLGDINGDGFDDIAFSASLPDSMSHICLGGYPSDTTTDFYVFGRIWGSGDFTGDGVPDVVTSFVYSRLIAPRGVVYFFRGFPDSLASLPYDSLWSPSQNAGRGDVVRVAHVDSDSIADLLVCQPDVAGRPALQLYYGGIAFDTIPDWTATTPYYLSHYLYSRDNFGFIDFNGDGYLDVFIGWAADKDSVGLVEIYCGPEFALEPDFSIRMPSEPGFVLPKSFATQCVANVKDINGDNFDDLAVYAPFGEPSAHIIVYLGGPTADTVYDYLLAPRCENAAAAGDINGDGYNDLLLGVSYRDPGGGIEVLLGGPTWDIYSDGYLTQTELPQSLLQWIGDRISSAGDFNGDGYDDLLFSCRNLSPNTKGDVFVAKGGADIATEAEDEYAYQSIECRLHQNFPNPFNPSTNISFDLPRRSRVTLTVVNVLGQEVVRLIDREMSAGSHSVEWDGRDASRESAASGVYLYRLTTNHGTLSRKMLLLK